MIPAGVVLFLTLEHCFAEMFYVELLFLSCIGGSGYSSTWSSYIIESRLFVVLTHLK